MKKILVVIIIVTASCLNLFGQGAMFQSNKDFGFTWAIFGDDERYPDTELDQEGIRIRYACEHAFEDASREPLRAKYVLQLGSHMSKFYQEIQHQADSLLDTGLTFKERYLLYGTGNFMYVQDCFYLEYATRKLTFAGRLVSEDFMYEEILPNIEWHLKDSVRTVCGYACRQATGCFRGREYIAWFTDEIPASAGPWKLTGLPGVILEAYDTDGVVNFRADSVHLSSGIIRRRDYPYVKVSRAQYARLQDQFIDAPGQFSSIHASRFGGKVIAGGKEKPLHRPVQIELD